MLKDLTPRLYQETILATCVNKNTLVVLPTGMGKTVVCLLLAIQRLKQYPQSKIIILAPTKPLVDQHMQSFIKNMDIDENKLNLFTGSVAPAKRQLLWEESQIIFSTPQGLENDILSNKIDIKEVSLMVFDEAHRAVGDYAYTFIAKKYNELARHPKILALTASPGSDLAKILEVCTNLFIEEVEIRTDQDPDVKPYIQEVTVEHILVDLPPEFLEVKKYIDTFLKNKLTQIKNYGLLNNINISKTELLRFQGQLQGMLAKGERSYELLKSLSVAAEVMKMQHALELLETQGLSMLLRYLEKLDIESATSKVKATQNIVKDVNFRSALIKTRALVESGIKHPKLDKLKELVKLEIENPDAKIILFTQFRDSAERIKEELDTLNVKSEIFVGQGKRGKKKGLTQKQQIAMLNEFKLGLFNVLIATSVAEEGLDIPQVDTVIFYEPIPSAIRHIQRRGRTGRLEKGKVFVLVARNTRDEGYRWSAYHKEKRMHRILRDLKTKLQFHTPAQKTLSSYEKSDLKIYADYREKGSNVLRNLSELTNIQLQKLEYGDYVLSKRVGVEFKSVTDFVNSLIDKRIFSQLHQLKKAYPRPVLIVQGEESMYSVRKIHPNAIRGMLATIMIDFGIPLLQTKNAQETAALLHIIAKREQDPKKTDFDPHSERKPLTLKEQQEYIISALPNIGPALATPLLKHFKSVRAIVNATEEDLKQVDLIGNIKAAGIRKILDEEYRE